MFYSPLGQIGLLVLATVTVYALAVGDRTVRFAAGMNVANWLLINLFQRRGDHLSFPWADFLIDAAFAGAFITMAVTARRTWLAVMAAFLILGVANYASHLTELRGWHRAFVTTSYLWAFAALGALMAGAWHTRRRERWERHRPEPRLPAPR